MKGRLKFVFPDLSHLIVYCIFASELIFKKIKKKLAFKDKQHTFALRIRINEGFCLVSA